MLDLRIFTCLITPEVFHVSLKTPTDFFIIIFSNRERIFLNWAQEQENSFAATVSRMMKKQRNRAVYSQSGTRVHTKVFGRPRDILRRHSHTSSVVSFGQWSIRNEATCLTSSTLSWNAKDFTSALNELQTFSPVPAPFTQPLFLPRFYRMEQFPQHVEFTPLKFHTEVLANVRRLEMSLVNTPLTYF